MILLSLMSLGQRIVIEAASPGTQLGYRVNTGTSQCCSLEASGEQTLERDLGFFLFLLSWIFCILQVKQ